AMFKRRVGDVYFSIVTQAIAAILSILIIGQQGLTGGVNGITDLKTLMGWDIRTDHAKLMLYFVNAGLLFGCILFGRYVLGS
ncbi:urea ABC transporter permease subunit UrtC, partial [Acinetobacter baumannii]